MSNSDMESGVVEHSEAPSALALATDSWAPGARADPLIFRKHGHVGKPVSRLDGPLKVAGAARFAAEYSFENMAYAAIAHSSISLGRLASIDSREAEAAPGVVAVMTYRNAPPLRPPPAFGSAPKASGSDSIAVMQDDRIYWNGQPIAVVLAESQEQADHAMSLLKVTYEVERACTAFEEAKAAGTATASFAGHALHDEVGDAEQALAEAEIKVDNIYRSPRQNHNAIELHGVTVAWQDGCLRVHDSTQFVSHTAYSMAHMLGVEESQVIVTSPYVGGGFGGKNLWQHQTLAAAAAKLIDRPVRLVLSREGVYRIVGGRSPTEQRLALGATRDGRLTALIHEGTTAKTPINLLPEPFILGTRCLYGAEAIKLDVQVVEIVMASNCFMRGPGEAVGSFALESAMDELAEALEIDPVALRIKNEPQKDPVSGKPFSSRNLVDAWRAGADRFGWEQRNPCPKQTMDGEWLVGMGCAAATYPYYRMPGGAARITLNRDGHATVDIAAHEMGMGTATAQTQVVAERLGLPLEAVRFNYGDSTLPGIVAAGASQQTASIGASVIAAQRALFAELLQAAGNSSPLAGLTIDEVGAYEGGLCKLDDPSRHESYASILSRANRDTFTVESAAPPPLEMMNWSIHSYGAMFCEARVNVVTGEVRISRFLGSFDCGRILNSKTAASQFRGAIIMGLGLALMEETQFDERSGRIMNPSLSEYHMPVHLDVPDIDVIWTDIPDPHTPSGARSVGEIGITGVGAAVANAIYNATGKRIRDLPITLDKLL